MMSSVLMTTSALHSARWSNAVVAHCSCGDVPNASVLVERPSGEENIGSIIMLIALEPQPRLLQLLFGGHRRRIGHRPMMEVAPKLPA